MSYSDSMDCSLPGSPFHGFSRQEHWSSFPCPPPKDLTHPSIKSKYLTSPALAGRLFKTRATWKAHQQQYYVLESFKYLNINLTCAPKRHRLKTDHETENNLIDDGHSDLCEVIRHCNSDLYLSSN